MTIKWTTKDQDYITYLSSTKYWLIFLHQNLFSINLQNFSLSLYFKGPKITICFINRWRWYIIKYASVSLILVKESLMSPLRKVYDRIYNNHLHFRCILKGQKIQSASSSDIIYVSKYIEYFMSPSFHHKGLWYIL